MLISAAWCTMTSNLPNISPEIIAGIVALPATETATEAPTATATFPPLFVRINSIAVNDTGNYVVEYETFGYTEVLP
jgi:hypothetical protein